MSESERFKVYAAAYLILENGGDILLSRRYQTGYQDGNYSLVSGHFDGGETAKECIIREAREEAGLELKPEDLEIVHVMHRLSSDREYFDVYLRAKKWTGKIINQEPDKCDDLKWFELNYLPNNMVPEVRFVLEQVNKKIYFSEFGWPN